METRRIDTDVEQHVRLLLPITEAADVIGAANYAHGLIRSSLPVIADVLHVIEEPAAGALAAIDDGASLEELRAGEVVGEAAAYLADRGIKHTTHIIRGDVVFSVLDTAEWLDCEQIVLPAQKRAEWSRLLAAYEPPGQAPRPASPMAAPLLLVDAGGTVLTRLGT